MFTVSQNGKLLPEAKYTWNEAERIFTTNEDNAVLDFGMTAKVTVVIGSCSTITAGKNSNVNVGIGSTIIGFCGSTISSEGESALSYFQKQAGFWKQHISLISGMIKLDENGVLSRVVEEKFI